MDEQPYEVVSRDRGIFPLFEEFFRFFHTLSFWKQWKGPKFDRGAHRERERAGPQGERRLHLAD